MLAYSLLWRIRFRKNVIMSKILFPIRGEKELKQALEEEAKKDGHGFSGYCRKVLSDHIALKKRKSVGKK